MTEPEVKRYIFDQPITVLIGEKVALEITFDHEGENVAITKIEGKIIKEDL